MRAGQGRGNVIFVGRVISEGITRFKAHISQQTGTDVKICLGRRASLALEATKALEVATEKMLKKATIQAELGIHASRFQILNYVSSNVGSGSQQSSQRNGISPYFGPQTTPGAQPSITSLLNKNEKKKGDLVVAKLVYYQGLSINIARSLY